MTDVAGVPARAPTQAKVPKPRPFMRLVNDDRRSLRRAAATLARRALGEPAGPGALRHERAVLAHAEHLMRLTRDVLPLGAADRETVGLACLLHDVGRGGGGKGHAGRGARLLMRDRRLPVGAGRRRLLAYLAAHHRGPVPAGGCDGYLRPADGARRARAMLGVLRAADVLDGRRGTTAAVRREGATLVIAGDVKAGKVRKKFRLLAEATGLDVRVEPSRLRLAA